MNIRGINKFTLLDYPKRIACIVFVGNCNFLCSYCHNPFLVVDPESQPLISEDNFFTFLEKRQNKLDGVVISGGEPTLRKNLVNFAKKIKNIGFLVKIDTNGSKPEIIEELYNNNCLDYVGLDYKSTAENYKSVSGSYDRFIYAKVKESISIVLKFNIDHDIRTTVHKSILSCKDLKKMREELDLLCVREWTLQQFNSTEIMDEKLNNQPTYSDLELIEIAKDLPRTSVRGLNGVIFNQ